MKKKSMRISSIELSMLIIFSILLILVGCGLLVNEFRHYRDIVADNQDAYLVNSVRYIDRNLHTGKSVIAYHYCSPQVTNTILLPVEEKCFAVICLISSFFKPPSILAR